MPNPFPAEFRADVSAVARKGKAPLRQIAKDFGISEPACIGGSRSLTARMASNGPGHHRPLTMRPCSCAKRTSGSNSSGRRPR